MSPAHARSPAGSSQDLTWLGKTIIVRVASLSSRYRLGSTARSTFDVRAVEPGNVFLDGAYEISAKMLAGYVTGEHRRFEVDVPASWWQHCRLSVPAWWRGMALVKRYRRKRPVRMTTSSVDIYFSRYLAYPLAEIILPPEDFGYGVVTDMISQEIISPGGWLARCEATETRYASRHEVANAMERVLGDVIREQEPDRWAGASSARDYLDVLARLGVNPDQLIPEAMLGRRLLCRGSRRRMTLADSRGCCWTSSPIRSGPRAPRAGGRTSGCGTRARAITARVPGPRGSAMAARFAWSACTRLSPGRSALAPGAA